MTSLYNIGEGHSTVETRNYPITGERTCRMVYVLAQNGNPLMPTERHGKVKHLLREGKAKVVRREPFTIQLLYDSKTFTQPITLGVDAGSKTIGLSASTETKELYAAEVALRTDVADNLSTRQQFRRARRSRKTRYRQARFSNRKRPQGWLAPSIEQKINTHMQAVKAVRKVLPITETVVEVAAFDIHKIKNPDVSGVEYQQGEQLGFWNVREYVLCRDGHVCQGCKGKSKDKVLNVHHIESRKTGGDAPNNLITLCETCHKAYHKGTLELKLRRGNSFRDAAFMGIMRWAFYDRLKAVYPNVRMTYGYITKSTRIRNGLEKTHATDALCIAGHPNAIRAIEWYRCKAVRTRNRQLHRATINKGGYRKANQAPREVFGYRLFDKVKMLNGTEGFVFSRRSSGYFDIRTLDGAKLSAGINYKKLQLVQRTNSLLTERRTAIPPRL